MENFKGRKGLRGNVLTGIITFVGAHRAGWHGVEGASTSSIIRGKANFYSFAHKYTKKYISDEQIQ